MTGRGGNVGDGPRVLDPRFVEFRHSGEPRLRDELVEDNAGLARHLARRFAHRGEPPEELDQVALIALLKAVERFEPERGGQFSTFAVPTIVGELKRHFRDRGWAVRVPRRVQELYLEVGASVSRLSQELGRSPTPAEVAERAEVPVETVIEALEAGGLYHLASLDQPGEDGRARDPAADDPFVPLEQRLIIEELLATLPARSPDRRASILRRLDAVRDRSTLRDQSDARVSTAHAQPALSPRRSGPFVMKEFSTSASFPAVPESAGAARRFVKEALGQRDLAPDDIEKALLLTSEVVTNAVVHARTEFQLSLRVTPGVIRVDVDDEGTGGELLTHAPRDAVRGRGLHIVDALAHRWGGEHRATGQHRVWFELEARS